MLIAVLSASNARSNRGKRPWLSRKPPRWAMAISVPEVSNKLIRKKLSTTPRTAGSSAPPMSALSRVGVSEGGSATTPLKVLNPSMTESAVTVRIPIRIAPGIPR